MFWNMLLFWGAAMFFVLWVFALMKLRQSEIELEYLKKINEQLAALKEKAAIGSVLDADTIEI